MMGDPIWRCPICKRFIKRDEVDMSLQGGVTMENGECIYNSRCVRCMTSYNTKEGIKGYLARGLVGLHDLARARHEAGYTRKERLTQFYVLGRFSFDECGNCMRLEKPTFKDLCAAWKPNEREARELYEVLTVDEANLYARGGMIRSYMSMREPCFAPLAVACSRGCGQAWTILNCEDVVFTESTQSYSHVACYKRTQAEAQRKEFLRAFNIAGFGEGVVNLITIPNEYHGPNAQNDPYVHPWYLCQVYEGKTFKLGWRKSVISIDWETSSVRLGDKFESEKVTKSDFHIHAWSYDKLTEYLKIIVPALNT